MAFLFRCDSLGKSFGRRTLFRDISISFDDGERTGVVGPNGSGKSTLLKILAGMEQPDDGTLTVRRNLRLGYLAQADTFEPGATVRSVLVDALAGVALGRARRRDAGDDPARQGRVHR